MALELLSPAGSPEALRAAVQSGCGAVYLGWGSFNARRSAKNFSDEEFADAIRYCHLRGVRVFLTLNTLLTDRELPLALDAARTACRLGVDSVLVQDWGLFALLREALPDLPLHASTQMSVFTAGGANEVYGDGCERVVIARECSREDTAAICKACPAEIEIFGHGALCMSYSGQCEMTALIGGRSGNRGTCAQPCRLPYGVNGPCRDAHPLSLKDANLSAYLRDMASMGVACLKLEGRLKRPEYVAVVTGIYRRLLDERRLPTAEESRALEQAFSRSGFTDGYWLGKKGKAMFGTRPENVPEPKALFARARETYENGKENRKIPVNLRLTVRRGEPVRLSGACAVRNGVTIALATGDAPEEARNRAVTAEELRQRLTKTGGTVFAADQIEIELDEGLMVSASAVNALRRELLDELAARRTDIPKRRELPASPLPEAPAGAAELDFTVSISRPDQLTAELLAERPAIVYIPAELLDKMDLMPYIGQAEFCAVLPRIFRTADEPVFRDILQRHPEVASAAIGNLGHLAIVKGLGKTLRGDFGLNVYNSRAVRFWQEAALKKLLSPSFSKLNTPIWQIRIHKLFFPNFCRMPAYPTYGYRPSLIMCKSSTMLWTRHGSPQVLKTPSLWI